MNFFQLRYAVAVADKLSVSAAAEELHITQSGVSQQLAKLEGELGFFLFSREKRGVTLTTKGARFIEEARLLLSEYDALCALAQTLRDTEEGIELTVGTSVIFRPRQTDRIAEFSKRYSEISLRMVDAWESDLPEMLRSNRVDVAMFGMDANHIDLTDCFIIPIRDERIMALVSRNNPLSALDRLPVEKLMDEKLIFAAPQTGSRRMIREALNRRGLKLPGAIYIQSLEARIHYVARDLGIAFCMDTSLSEPLKEVAAIPVDPLMLRTYVVGFSPLMRANHPMTVKLIERFVVDIRGDVGAVSEADDTDGGT